MLREREKERKRKGEEGESLLRRIGVRLWQEKKVEREQKRGRMMKGLKDGENQVQTRKRRR